MWLLKSPVQPSYFYLPHKQGRPLTSPNPTIKIEHSSHPKHNPPLQERLKLIHKILLFGCTQRDPNNVGIIAVNLGSNTWVIKFMNRFKRQSHKRNLNQLGIYMGNISLQA